jgi:hypothetical protein
MGFLLHYPLFIPPSRKGRWGRGSPICRVVAASEINGILTVRRSRDGRMGVELIPGGHMRISIITYCSRDKDPVEGPLPAIDRYLSPRIRTSGKVAGSLGVNFHILSGLYGLLEPEREIPNYDHLLTALQVQDHASLLKKQLSDWGMGKVVFVTRTLVVDPGTGPYREAIRQACRDGDVGLDILEIGPEDPEDGNLEVRIREILS